MQEKLTPPADLTNTLQCLDNLTSTCLQQKLNFLYLEYQAEANKISETAEDSIFLNEQLALIPELNKQSLEFYRQILFSYPLHIQNTKIIENLETLIDNLKDLEDAMQPYSNVFHNVTTPYCQ
jgi:transcriptional/translational regulatory protein YebC/TACO1